MALQQKQILFFLCFLLLLGNMFTFGVIYTKTAPVLAGRAQSAEASFCINHPPEVTVPCNDTISQNSSYFCQLNVTDIDGNGYTVTQIPTDQYVLPVNSSGGISFVPNQTHVGNHSTTFVVMDDSGCLYNLGQVEFSFSISNINDPPYLVQNIPDQSFSANTTLNSFFLSDYFYDPDGDPLNFTSSIPDGVTVTILSDSQVVFSSSICNNDGVLVTFSAEDPYGGSAASNAVTIKVTCATSSSASSSSGGGGGGGGGGATTICRENWECEEWFACLPTGMQWQRCWDRGGCESDKYLKRNCTYGGPEVECQENWLCEEWGKCLINNTQSRACKDLSECKTTIVQPPLSQACIYQPTCNDGIQNGDETGIDCGGNLCSACALVQQPSLISGDAGLPTWLLILIILSILVVSGVAHYYRAQIAQGIAAIGFMLKHRKAKDVLLDAAERRSLFERIREFEVRMFTLKPDQLYVGLAELIRNYIVEALDVHFEALPEEIAARLKQLKVQRETEAMVTGLFQKVDLLEHEELEMNEYFIQATLEELRTVVCMTSDYKIEELLRPIDEIPVSEKMSFYDEIFARTVNALRAVQFNQLEVAKREYLTTLTRYDPLSVEEKEQIYPQLQWTFQTVKFRSEITGIRILQKPAVNTSA